MYTTTTDANLRGLNDFKYERNQDIDEILRGEISAKEAYEQVLSKLDDDPEAGRLQKFRDQHSYACNYWQRKTKALGKVPESTSGIWGTVVTAFVGVSKVLGESAALMALKQGEEHGLENYEKMLESKLLTQSQKDEILRTFIPRQKQHIESISAMIKMK